GKLRYLLREPSVGKILDSREWKCLRRQRESQDRRIGRIDLAVDRRIRQISRQEILTSVDCGLNFLFRHIDAQIQRKLERNDRTSAGTRRGHMIQARHLSELSFQACSE